MDELLEKLTESDLLTAETREEIKTLYTQKIDEAVEEAKKEAAEDTRAELTEQWIQERDALIEALDSKVEEFLREELDELRDDISSFRDLEAEYAEKIVEAREQMSDELKNDLVELVEKLDTFLEMRLSAEFEELREDITEVRKNEFGRKIFEAVASEYEMSYAGEDGSDATRTELEERLEDTVEALEETERKLSTLERKIKMESVLSPLSGRARDVMEAILKSVPTESLEEGYSTFIGRVMREADTSEKEEPVLAEGNEEDGNDVKDSLKEGVSITGDDVERLEEEHQLRQRQSGLSQEARLRLRQLGGIGAVD